MKKWLTVTVVAIAAFFAGGCELTDLLQQYFPPPDPAPEACSEECVISDEAVDDLMDWMSDLIDTP